MTEKGTPAEEKFNASISRVIDLLIDARVRSEKSQRELAKLIGIAPSNLSRYEAKLTQPSRRTLATWADKLEFDLGLVLIQR